MNKFALPKGSLFPMLKKLSKNSGHKITCFPRMYRIDIENLNEQECWMAKPSEIPKAVFDGIYDYGITGMDCLVESGLEKDLHIVGEMNFSKSSHQDALWVIAVDNKSDIIHVKDLYGKKIATEKPNMLRAYLDKKGIKAEIILSSGATESKVKLGLADAICDIMETGESLDAQNLRVVCKVMRTYPVLIAKTKDIPNEVNLYIDCLNFASQPKMLRAEIIVPSYLPKEISDQCYSIYKSKDQLDNKIVYIGLFKEKEIPKLVGITKEKNGILIVSEHIAFYQK